MTEIKPTAIKDRKEPYWAKLNQIIDPELDLGLVDLGLIYNVNIAEDGHAHVRMTLTSPACPVGPILVQQVQDKMQIYPGVSDVQVEIVWEPFWNHDLVDPEVRDMMFGI